MLEVVVVCCGVVNVEGLLGDEARDVFVALVLGRGIRGFLGWGRHLLVCEEGVDEVGGNWRRM